MVEIISRAEWEYLLHQSYDLQRQIRRAEMRGDHAAVKALWLRLSPLSKRIRSPLLRVQGIDIPQPLSERKAGC